VTLGTEFLPISPEDMERRKWEACDFIFVSGDAYVDHPLSRQLRERQDIPEGCRHCDFLVECGGGCPLSRDHQSVAPIFSEIM